MANPFVDYYSILHVAPDATKKQIKNAFFKLKKRFQKNTSSKEWRDIYIARSVLSDDHKRAIYDKSYQEHKKKQNIPIIPVHNNTIPVIPKKTRNRKRKRNKWNLGNQYQLAESYQSMHHSRFNNYNDPYSLYNDIYYDDLFNDIYYDDFGEDCHHNNCSPEKKSNFWKYFRNFGLICVGCDCLYYVKENDSATIWTIAFRCLSGVAIVYICWGCGTVIYTTIKWTAVKLYKLCAFICIWWGEQLLVFLTCAGCVIVIFEITKCISVKLYNCVTYMSNEMVDIAVKILPSPWPPLVKGSIILFSIGCVGWGVHKFFRSVIG